MPGAVLHILFDLDGTLLDTGPDLAHALNETRREHGLTPQDYALIRPVVSLGGAAMIKVAFGLDREDPEFIPVRDRFLEHYRDNICRHTVYFPGVEAMLEELDNSSIGWGIVTNKPGWLTAPLLEAMALHTRAAAIVSGDTLPVAKPDPAPLLHACRQMGASPDSTVYVGDARRDIEAGQRAGMSTVLARYGYINQDDNPDLWGATLSIDSADQLLPRLRGQP